MHFLGYSGRPDTCILQSGNVGTKLCPFGLGLESLHLLKMTSYFQFTLIWLPTRTIFVQKDPIT